MAHNTYCCTCRNCHTDCRYYGSDTDRLPGFWDFDEGFFVTGSSRQITHRSVDAHVFQSPFLAQERREGTRFHGICPLHTSSNDRIPSTARHLYLPQNGISYSSDVPISEPVYEGGFLAYNTDLVQRPSPSTQRDIDPREITARMDSPIVKAVLNMDIPKPRIKEAIKTRLAENGEDFTSAEALLEAIFSSGSGGSGEVSDSISDSKNEQDRRHPSESESPDSLKLMEENRLLKEQRQCKICMDEEVCVVFLPCGHLVCCSTCAPALNLCPICRAKIRGTVRTYIS